MTLAELNDAPATVRSVYADLPAACIEDLSIAEGANDLAQAYIDAGALRESCRADATHVAAATIARASLILSWNFRHIVNYDRIRKFNSVNVLKGYPPVEIRCPLEVGYDNEDKDI